MFAASTRAHARHSHRGLRHVIVWGLIQSNPCSAASRNALSQRIVATHCRDALSRRIVATHCRNALSRRIVATHCRTCFHPLRPASWGARYTSPLLPCDASPRVVQCEAHVAAADAVRCFGEVPARHRLGAHRSQKAPRWTPRRQVVRSRAGLASSGAASRADPALEPVASGAASRASSAPPHPLRDTLIAREHSAVRFSQYSRRVKSRSRAGCGGEASR